jgi:hypothetical protein
MVNTIHYRGYCDDQTGNPMKHGTIVYDHGPLMLGSEFHDKNGKRIYEDDIVLVRTRSVWEYSLVLFARGEFRVMTSRWPVCIGSLRYYKPDDIEVIGNIHEGEYD